MNELWFNFVSVHFGAVSLFKIKLDFFLCLMYAFFDGLKVDAFTPPHNRSENCILKEKEIYKEV